MRPLSLSCLLITGCAASIDKTSGDPVGDPLRGISSVDGDDSGTTEGTTSTSIDADMDGFDLDEDCDDTNPAIHPGADEYCNNIDDDIAIIFCPREFVFDDAKISEKIDLAVTIKLVQPVNRQNWSWNLMKHRAPIWTDIYGHPGAWGSL